MTAKDAAFVTIFILFVVSVVGNAFLLPYYLEGNQAEKDLKNRVTTLENEKNNLYYEYQQEIDELEDENEDLEDEIRTLESTIEQLKRELESQSGTSLSYEGLLDSLRGRIYELEAETLQLQGDLAECEAHKDTYWGRHCYCGPCYYDPCYYCPPYYSCYKSVSVSNVSGIFNGNAYDAVIFVYFHPHHPCYVLKIYIDILDLSTVQIVGVDWG